MQFLEELLFMLLLYHIPTEKARRQPVFLYICYRIVLSEMLIRRYPPEAAL